MTSNQYDEGEDQIIEADPAAAKEPSSDRSSRNETAEIFRLTIPLISRHGFSFEPDSYAVWYEYTSGVNKPLRKEIDEALSKTTRLNKAQTTALYQKYIAGEREKSLMVGRAELLRLLRTVNSTVDGASSSTVLFDSQLAEHANAIDQGLDEDTFRQHVSSLRSEVVNAKGSMEQLSKDLDVSQVEIDRLTIELSQARREARIDPLSGLLNRRGFFAELQKSIDKCVKDETHKASTALIIFDIDHFKPINDRHGHLSGDKAIQFVGQILYHGVMRKDSVSRFGGEEFAIVLPDTDSIGAMAVANRMCAAIREQTAEMYKRGQLADKITVSGGVSIFKRGETQEAFIGRADEALYQAKSSGRDQVCLHGTQPGSKG